jgi:hypothetical protein
MGASASRRDSKKLAPGRASLRATTRGSFPHSAAPSVPALAASFSSSLRGVIHRTGARKRMRPRGRDGWNFARGMEDPGWSLASSLDPGLISFDASGVLRRPRKSAQDATILKVGTAENAERGTAATITYSVRRQNPLDVGCWMFCLSPKIARWQQRRHKTA